MTHATRTSGSSPSVLLVALLAGALVLVPATADAAAAADGRPPTTTTTARTADHDCEVARPRPAWARSWRRASSMARSGRPACAVPDRSVAATADDLEGTEADGAPSGWHWPTHRRSDGDRDHGAEDRHHDRPDDGESDQGDPDDGAAGGDDGPAGPGPDGGDDADADDDERADEGEGPDAPAPDASDRSDDETSSDDGPLDPPSKGGPDADPAPDDAVAATGGAGTEGVDRSPNEEASPGDDPDPATDSPGAPTRSGSPEPAAPVPTRPGAPTGPPGADEAVIEQAPGVLAAQTAVGLAIGRPDGLRSVPSSVAPQVALPATVAVIVAVALLAQGRLARRRTDETWFPAEIGGRRRRFR